MSGHWIILRSAEGWARQGDAALDQLTAANGGVTPATLADAAKVDRAAFGSLVEALVALGADVDDEIRQLANVRPIEDLL